MNEHENRKSLRKLCKEVAKLNFREEAYESLNKHIQIDIKEKRPEIQLRMKYWDYFRTGQHNLMMYMTYFGDRIAELEKVTNDNKAVIHKKNTDETIKKYILIMEQKLEENFYTINLMKKKIDEFEDRRKGGEDED